MKRKNNFSLRSFSLLIVVFLFIISISYGLLIEEYRKDDHINYNNKNDINNISDRFSLKEDNTVDENFRSSLPLIVIDTKGEEPKADTVWDKEKGYRVPVDYDPYVTGDIAIIDREDGVNSLKDEPSLKSNIRIRLRGNSSLSFDKKQYFIKFINKDGSKNKQNVMDMGEDWEWILNISMIDKSLLRNYIGFSIASKIMPYTPQVKFCEVIMKNGTKNMYKGVYLMMESIKQGSSRINIAEYDQHFVSTSYILRRDRFDEDGIMLNNYGTQAQITEGFLDIKYPTKNKITDRTIQYIEDDISEFEKIIYSKDPNVFLTYSEHINKQSFLDYFIINEFFANYDSKYNSIYMYKDNGGKISMGPVWDFDRAIDNFDYKSLKIESTAMHSATWFTQLLRDSNFVTSLIGRYHELRKTVLSDENIIKDIDGAVEYLGHARERDWNRWGYFYTSNYLNDISDENGNIILRNTKNYEEEVKKIKTVLIEHGRWLDDNIDSLYQFSEYSDKHNNYNWLYKLSQIAFGKSIETWSGGVLAVLFIGVFIISIVLIQRE